MIDTFDRQTFESALPCIKGTKQTLWTPLGLIDGEYCYLMSVKPGVVIVIRSSIHAKGLSAPSGEDSIRCWLASGPDGASLGSKNSRWVTRIAGWEGRLTETLRTLWRLGHQLKSCPTCGGQMKAFRTREGENKGRWFMKCPQCYRFDCWLSEPPEKKLNKESKNATR